MLVLSRKLSETINIGENVKVTVIEIRGDRVRLGIEAPREIGVHRGEVQESIERDEIREKRKENRHAAND